MTTDTTQLADSQHPWIGLTSFTESDREFFAGRGEEIDELLRLVRRDILTLLHGVSGLGKTSLLQAGLFPALRAEDCLPIPIRLDYLEGAAPLTAQVLGAIIAAADAARVEAPQPLPDQTLWEYLHREGNHFWSPHNDLVTPLLAFDQFEELFTLVRQTPGCVARTNAFISELADLVENRPPAALRDDPLGAKEFSFKPAPLKVLLVMREDYLADLDRIRSHFRALGQNRQRLLPMGERQARQVIALGATLLAPFVDDRILKFVAGADEDAEMTIAPALLSLVLRELNERRLARGPDAKITPDLLDVEQQKIFEDFYLRTIQNFPLGVRNFIEDKLLTTTGYRDSCALDDALSCQDVTQPALNELVDRRLLAYEDRHNTRRVELTHDVLIPVIKASRDARLTRETLAQAEQQQREAYQKERLARRRLAFVAVLLVLAVAGAIYGWVQAHRADQAAKQAQEQARIAETRRLAAKASEKNANDARDQADGLINFMLYDLHDKLEPIGRLAILDDVAKKSKEYLDKLPKELVTASRLEQQAGMLDNLGDVRAAQGKLQEALDLYQQGLKIRQTLVAQDKSNSGWERDLSVSYQKVGGVLVAQGKLQDALDLYQQSLKIRQTLAEQDKSNSGWQRDLSRSYEKVGGVLVAQGKLQQALDACHQSLAIAKHLAEQDQSNSGWQRDLLASYNKVGDVLVAQGKLQEALDSYQLGLAIAKHLTEQDQSNSDWQRDLSVSYEEVGDALVPQGKLQEALNLYQQCLKIQQALAEQDQSNSDWQRDLSVGFDKVGNVRVAQGKLQDALDAYQQALAITKRLAEQDQSNSVSQRGLVVSCSKVGDVLAAQGKLQDALDAYQLGLAIAKHLVEQDQSNSGWQRDLAANYEKVADVLVAQGKLQDALDAYQQDLAIAKRLVEQDQSNSGWQYDLAVSYEMFGDVLVAQGKLQDALDACQQSMKILQRLAEQDQSNSGWQRELALSYDKVGAVLEAQGKLQDALDAYQQDQAIVKRLVEQDQSNSGWQHDISLSCIKVGEVLIGQGKYQDALDAFLQGLTIGKRLVEQDQSNSGWQHDLSVSYVWVGNAEAAQGNFKEALDAYQQGLAIGKRLVEQDKSNSRWQRDLIVSLLNAGTITARIGGNDNVTRAVDLLQTGLKLAERYPGPDRQNLIDALNLASRNLVR
jgi:tetratricopeptide (TPR) repeat protein